MTEKNVFTAQNIGDLTAEQYEGVERGILDMIEMTGEVVLTGKASMVLWQVAAGMAYKGQLTREMHERGGEIQEHGVSLLHMAGRLAATGHWMSK